MAESGEREVGGGRWAVGGGRWAVGGGWWAVGGGRWSGLKAELRAGGGRGLVFFEVVGVHALDGEGAGGADADAVLDHELGEALAVDEDDFVLDGAGVGISPDWPRPMM